MPGVSGLDTVRGIIQGLVEKVVFLSFFIV